MGELQNGNKLTKLRRCVSLPTNGLTVVGAGDADALDFFTLLLILFNDEKNSIECFYADASKNITRIANAVQGHT